MIPQRYFPKEKLGHKQGEELRGLLDELGWTQWDFSKHIKVRAATVTHWVKNRQRIPRVVFLYLNTLKRLNGQAKTGQNHS